MKVNKLMNKSIHFPDIVQYYFVQQLFSNEKKS